MFQHGNYEPHASATSQVLGGEKAVYIATDDDNRTALEPLIKAFPQVLHGCLRIQCRIRTLWWETWSRTCKLLMTNDVVQ